MPEFDFDHMENSTAVFTTEDPAATLQDFFELAFHNSTLVLSFLEEGEHMFGEELTPEKVDKLIAALSAWKAWRNA